MKAGTKANPNSSTESDAVSGQIAVEVTVDSGRSPTLERTSGSGMILSGQPAPLTMPFAPGDVVGGKYQVIGLIGAGGVAFVVAALHLELGEMVALKFLRPESLAHEEVVERFATEARAAARIKSEHVCRVYDVGTLPDGAPFIVMEYLEGKDLSDLVREEGKIPVKLAVDYVLQTCEALASAHAAGIVHRDIKPENLFVTKQAGSVQAVKVLDFGISKTAIKAATGGKRRFAKTMMPMGTPAYMSPEQIRACGTVDGRSDIWALGCVLFELVTGSCAFDAPTLMQLGAAILERDAIPLRKVLPDAPAELEAAILKCLEKDASKRFQNVAELANVLYPFGSRRARHSAERCSHILHSAGMGGAPLELSSVGPPPLAVLQALPSMKSPPAVNAGKEAEALSTSTPASISVVHEEFRPRKSRALPIALIGLGAALAAGFAYRLSSTGDSATNETARSAGPVEAPTLSAPSSPGSTPAPVPSQAAAAVTSESVGTEPEASEKPRARRLRAQPPPPPVRARPVPSQKVKPTVPLGVDEPDVGF
jgi:serine/threonine-protein kinase